MRILIVDDETPAREIIHTAIAKHIDETASIQEAESVNSAIDLIDNNEFDIVFLDIRMNDGTGFDVLEATQAGSNYHVVFITAYDQYALKAIKFNALDYILKPLDIEELSEVYERVRTDIKAGKGSVGEREVIHPSENLKKIALPYKTGFVYLDLESIRYIEAEGSYSHIYTNTDKYTAAKKIKYFEELFEDSRFCRIHASFIINLDRLRIFTKRNGGEVELDDGTVLSVSKSRRQDLLRKMKV